MSKLFIYFSVFLLILSSCRQTSNPATDAGNPGRGKLTIRGADLSSEAAFMAATLDSGIEINFAKIVLSEIEFKRSEDCEGESEDENEFEIEGPFIVDLIDNTETPSLSTFDLPNESYCRLEMKMDQLEEDERPAGVAADDEIVGKSLLIQGRTAEDVEFVFELDRDEEFRLENLEDGFLTTDEVRSFLVIFDFSQWFNGVDFSGADDIEGVIYLNEDSNEEIFNLILGNIKNSSRLREDKDDDGELDDDEDDDLAEGS